MKTVTIINIIFLIISLNIVHHRVYSYRILNKKLNIKNGMEPYLITDSSSPIEEDIIPNKDSDFDSNSLERRASESAEKYFDWASKTNRPMEYFRGRRFWLFTKKDEHAHHHETIPGVSVPPNSISQGIWRSGIVGRRR